MYLHSFKAIHNLALAFEDDSEKNTSPLSNYFQTLLEKLIRTADRFEFFFREWILTVFFCRDDSDENNLRTSAYEAINVMIQAGAKDTNQAIFVVTPLFMERLEKTFSMQVLFQIKPQKMIIFPRLSPRMTKKSKQNCNLCFVECCK